MYKGYALTTVNEMNILITSIGDKTNLIRYFRRAQINESGGEIVGADCNPVNKGRFFVDKFCTSPKSHDPDFTSWLIKTINQYDIRLIVPSRDGDLKILSEVKDQLISKSKCHVAVADSDIIDTCLDKRLFSNWCLHNGFDVPRILDTELIDETYLPVFIRPKNSSGSKGCFKIDNMHQWGKMQSNVTDAYLVQEFINGQEYSIDVYVDHAGEVRCAVPRARIRVENGESVQAEIVHNEELITKTRELCKKLNLSGHNTVQCFLERERVLFTEVNPRFGGGFTLSVEAGFDTPRYLIRESIGKSISVPSVSQANGMGMVRIQKDLIFKKYQSGKIYCFDLDGTICSESCEYEAAEKISMVVEKIKKLHKQGNKVIIMTARGAVSKKDWSVLVTSQLDKWDIPYDEVYYDKPYADYYIDNKAINILDFI